MRGAIVSGPAWMLAGLFWWLARELRGEEAAPIAAMACGVCVFMAATLWADARR